MQLISYYNSAVGGYLTPAALILKNFQCEKSCIFSCEKEYLRCSDNRFFEKNAVWYIQNAAGIE